MRKATVRAAKVLELLAEEPATLHELSDALALPSGRVRYSLDSLHMERRVHILTYRENTYLSGAHRSVPVYALGQGQDAPAPAGKNPCQGLDFLKGLAVQDVYMHWLTEPLEGEE